VSYTGYDSLGRVTGHKQRTDNVDAPAQDAVPWHRPDGVDVHLCGGFVQLSEDAGASAANRLVL